MIKDNFKHLISRVYFPKKKHYDYYDLMFHSVVSGARRRYELEPVKFENILQSISSNINNIHVSFDDGLVCAYNNVRYIVKNLNIRPTIFLSTEHIGQEGYLTIRQIEQLGSDGWTLGGHGHDHVALGRLSDEDCCYQLKRSISFLQNIVSPNCKIPMSLPFGSFNKNTVQLVKKFGFDACYNSKYGGWNAGDYFRNRIEIWGSDDEYSVHRKLQGRYGFLVKNEHVD